RAWFALNALFSAFSLLSGITFRPLLAVCAILPSMPLFAFEAGQPFRFGAYEAIIHSYLVCTFAWVTLRPLTARSTLRYGNIEYILFGGCCYIYFHVSVIDLVIVI